MKRLIPAAILIFVLSLFPAAADSGASELSPLANPQASPLSSVSGFGRFSDVFANPAALVMMETDTGPFALTLGISDLYSAGEFSSDRLPFVQNQLWNMGLSFIADHIALSAFFGTEFMRQDQDRTLFDIRSSLRIELDMAYSIPHFSFGMRISGGNSMLRGSKKMTGITDIFANAWFSPFERERDSQFFDVGVGAILTFGPFSGGIYSGSIVTLRDENIYLGWDAIAESTSLSLSVSADRFLPSGDLRFFRPGLSLSMTGLTDAESRSIEAEAELTFQFLPDASFSLAASYLEFRHSLFRFDTDNAFLNIAARGDWSGFSVTLGVSFRVSEWSDFAPSIIFSYIS